MPPKCKFSKEEIVKAALKIVQTNGLDALTARALGESLNSSPRPIFTVFSGMDEVQSEVKAAAKRLYESYQDESMKCEKAFMGSGLGYIKFAAEQPKLFQLLFMQEQEADPANILNAIDDYYEKILSSVEKEYGFTREVAKSVYMHLWIYSHGIAVLTATKVCAFSEEEIRQMLFEVGGAIIRKYRAEGKL